MGIFQTQTSAGTIFAQLLFPDIQIDKDIPFPSVEDVFWLINNKLEYLFAHPLADLPAVFF